MGFFSVWRLLRRRLGLVHLAGRARTVLVIFVCLAPGKFLAQTRLGALRSSLRHFSAHRTGRDGRSSLAGDLDSVSPLSARPPVESSDDRRSLGRSNHAVSLARAELYALSPV